MVSMVLFFCHWASVSHTIGFDPERSSIVACPLSARRNNEQQSWCAATRRSNTNQVQKGIPASTSTTPVYCRCSRSWHETLSVAWSTVTIHDHTNGHLPTDILPRGDGPRKHTSGRLSITTRCLPSPLTCVAAGVLLARDTERRMVHCDHLVSSVFPHHHTVTPVTTHVHTIGRGRKRDEQRWSAWSSKSHFFATHSTMSLPAQT